MSEGNKRNSDPPPGVHILNLLMRRVRYATGSLFEAPQLYKSVLFLLVFVVDNMLRWANK